MKNMLLKNSKKLQFELIKCKNNATIDSRILEYKTRRICISFNATIMKIPVHAEKKDENSQASIFG
ncbi:MAG: hypothetical protein ACMUHX_07030 [bacterium]